MSNCIKKIIIVMVIKIKKARKGLNTNLALAPNLFPRATTPGNPNFALFQHIEIIHIIV